MTQSCGGAEEELPTIVRKVTELLGSGKQESLRYFLVITGMLPAPGTLKHLCVHFKFPVMTFIQGLCPVLGVRENKKLPLLSKSAGWWRAGYSIAQLCQ